MSEGTVSIERRMAETALLSDRKSSANDAAKRLEFIREESPQLRSGMSSLQKIRESAQNTELKRKTLYDKMDDEPSLSLKKKRD